MLRYSRLITNRSQLIRQFATTTTTTTTTTANYSRGDAAGLDSSKPYDGYINMNSFQRTILTIGSGIGCLLNPRRADLLSTFGETSAEPALRTIHQKMLADPVGYRILQDKPSIRTNTVDMNFLRTLPLGTFGNAYVTFLDHYNYSPDERHYVQFIRDPELAYVMLRYREIHDLVHTLLEQPTDMLGEVVVKWVEGIQTRLPMCLTAGYFGSLRLAPKQTDLYLKSHLDYALRVGSQAHFLMAVYFEEHWSDNIVQLRESLNVPHPPPRPTKKKSV